MMYPRSFLGVVLGLVLGCSLFGSVVTYNPEIKERVKERVADLLRLPVQAVELTKTFRDAGGLTNHLQASDRNDILRFMYIQLATMGLKVYVGLEDGTFLAYGDTYLVVSYREPGHDAYEITTTTTTTFDATLTTTRTTRMVEPPSMELYHDKCVDDMTGESTLCILSDYSYYIECNKIDGSDDECDTSLQPCLDPASQALWEMCLVVLQGDLIDADDAERASACAEEYPDIKWCSSYTKQQLLPNQTTVSSTSTASGSSNSTTTVINQRGFVPFTFSCIDEFGQLTQTPGRAIVQSTLAQDNNLTESVYGNCLFGDGTTMVQRSESGPFAYCGEDGQTICNDTFVGGQVSLNYDPRYRGWYEDVKRLQDSVWSAPYPFFLNVNMGITYGVPIYDTERVSVASNTSTSVGDDTEGSDGNAAIVERQVFAGVLAIDYLLRGVSTFLKDAYSDSEHLVAIIEPEAPHYLIGLSTGSDPGRQVQVNFEDPDAPLEDCVDTALGRQKECTIIRVSVEDLASSDVVMDKVIRLAFLEQKKAGFPQDSLVAIKQNDSIGSAAFSSQTQTYEEGNLKWIIMVVSPLEESTTDTIGESALLRLAVVMTGILGFLLCSALFLSFWQYRAEPTMRHADWRFTLAFLAGCAVLNLSTLTLLGENTDLMCMLRMWSFHFLFAAALSPLFVKVWRMYALVTNSEQGRRVAITNTQAALYTIPIVLVQALILTIFSIVDPPRQVENIEISENWETMHTISCAHETSTFFIVQLVFGAALLVLGCGLAYLSRDIDVKFGEARQLIFALYNIAFTELIVVLILLLVDGMSQSSQYALQAIGVFWASLVGSSVFALPRLMQAKEAIRSNTNTNIRISGIDLTRRTPPTNSGASSGAPNWSVDTTMTSVKEGELKEAAVEDESQWVPIDCGD